jgi:CBS-domain-containing membrane protein
MTNANERARAEKSLVHKATKTVPQIRSCYRVPDVTTQKKHEINANRSPVTQQRLKNLAMEGAMKNKVKCIEPSAKFNHFRNHEKSNIY